MKPFISAAAVLVASLAATACSRTDPKPQLGSKTMNQPASNSSDRGLVRPEPSPGQVEQAAEIMARFAARTGLTSEPGSGRAPQRYLWTDAFAVCNYLGLARATGDPQYTARALELVEQVHRTLGRYREDDAREGWLAGPEGAEHPTAGGLRIGKELPERGPEERFEPQLEWDRDGQYFHYLTKWMHALDLLARAEAEPRFHRWSRELAELAHARFVYRPRPGARARMYWKMSVDLSRPQVPSMGQHDPLDGLITLAQIRATGRALASVPDPALDAELADFAAMLEGQDLATDDPLGLGGLLLDLARVEQIMDPATPVDPALLERLLDAALTGLDHYARGGELHRPAHLRLAFRELGLAIGLDAVAPLVRAAQQHPERFNGLEGAATRLKKLAPHLALADAIEAFWLDPQNRQAPTWSDHRDINEVMLATSLVPNGCAVLPSPS